MVKVEKPSFTRFLDTIHPHTSLFIARRPLSQPAVSAARSVTTHLLAALTQEGARIILRRNQSYQYVEVFSASFSIMEIIATLGTPNPVFSLSDSLTLTKTLSLYPSLRSLFRSLFSHWLSTFAPVSYTSLALLSSFSTQFPPRFTHSLLFPFPSRSPSLSL